MASFFLYYFYILDTQQRKVFSVEVLLLEGQVVGIRRIEAPKYSCLQDPYEKHPRHSDLVCVRNIPDPVSRIPMKSTPGTPVSKIPVRSTPGTPVSVIKLLHGIVYFRTSPTDY